MRRQERRQKRRDRRARGEGVIARLRKMELGKKAARAFAHLSGVFASGFFGPVAKWAIVAAIIGAIAFVTWRLSG